MKTKFFFQFLTISLLIVFQSCRKQELDSPIEDPKIANTSSTIDPELYSILKCNGFGVEHAKDFGDHIYVDGVIIYKDAILDLKYGKYEFQFENQAKTRQYAVSSGTLVNMDKVKYIKVYIDPSLQTFCMGAGNDFWNIAALNAISNWNKIDYCRVQFVPHSTHSTADISIFFDNNTNLPLGLRNLSINQCGQSCCKDTWTTGASCFPKSGNPGRYISINDYYQNCAFSLTEKTYIIMHEIGHALGLRHDGGYESSGIDPCGNVYSAPFKISGTLTSDPASTMGSAAQLPFSPNDLKAAQYLYPESYMQPVINSANSATNGSTVTLVTKTITGQLPYKAQVLRYNIYGGLKATYDFMNPSASQSLTVNCPPGVWIFKVAYVNYGSYGTISSGYAVIVGSVEIKRKNYSSLNIDAKNCGGSWGTQIHLWTDNNLDCQRWDFQLQTDGSYEIKRRGTVFNLDAAGCGNTAGTALQLWDDNNLNCQRWTISLESDNHFEIKRKGTALNIDAAGCGYTAGTPVHLWTDNNLDCQRWFISPI